MQSITFALPTLAAAGMPRNEQGDLLLNQATAAIVCSYLEHMNAAISKGIIGATADAQSGFISMAELPILINNVQGALRGVV